MLRVPVFKPPGVSAIPETMAIPGLQGVRGQDPGSGRMPPGCGKKGEVRMAMEQKMSDIDFRIDLWDEALAYARGEEFA